MSETSPTSPTASWPIISGSITSTTLTTWDRLVCSLTGLIKLHDRFTKYQILSNSICCFVRCTFICVHLYQQDITCGFYITCGCLSVLAPYLSVQPPSIFVFPACLSTHLHSSACPYMGSYERVFMFYRLWCPCLCWHRRTAGSTSCIMVWMQWQWTSR